MRGQWESHPQPGTMFNPLNFSTMEQKIYNLYENMTDSFTAYRDIDYHLMNEALEVIKSAFETLIEKGLCEFIPKDEYIDEDCYCYAIKDFSTDEPGYEDLANVVYYMERKKVGLFFEGEDITDYPMTDSDDLGADILFDLASHLYHEVENL